MDVSVRDQVVIEGERVGQPARKGTVEEVMSSDPLRVRVRWEDDSVSIIAPDAGAAHIEHPAQPGAATSS